MNVETRTTGRCLCGTIRYTYQGAPRWVAHCHCESCRRATSSAFATFLGVESARFSIESGADELTRFASSPGVERSFCRRCGSPITFIGEKWPGEVHIYAGTLDEPASIVPQAHVNVGEALPWADIADQLPRYERMARGATPMRRGPAVHS
jgi:hypothetical protein